MERLLVRRGGTATVMGMLCVGLMGCGASGSSSGGKAPAPVPTADEVARPVVHVPDPMALQATLDEAVKGVRGKVHVHVRVQVPLPRRPNNEVEAGVNADTPVPAASVIKLPLVLAAQAAWASGVLERTPADGERVRKMIMHSDNPAADAMMDRVGLPQVNQWLDEHGYRNTRVRHRMLGKDKSGANLVTAREMTGMLMGIVREELVSAEASREVRELLLAQTRRARIPAGLPKAAVVGNKTGTLRGIVHDVAFVEPPDGPRYALAVLISGAGSEERASRAIARISKVVYAAVTAGSK